MYLAIVTHNFTLVKNYLDLLNKGATIQSAGGGGCSFSRMLITLITCLYIVEVNYLFHTKSLL